MTTAFPGAIDNFTNPVAADPLDSATVPHASQHANINDAVEAIETAIGTTAVPVLAKLASPTFTGTPTLPTGTIAVTQTAGNNTTAVATTAFVKANSASVGFGFVSTYYYRTLLRADQVTAVLSRTYYYPFIANSTATFDRIAIQTNSSYVGTGSVRLGIYNNDSATGKPSTVLLDAGTVSTTAASTIYQITISQSLTVGNYWLAFNMQTAAATPFYNGYGSISYPTIYNQNAGTTAFGTDVGGWIENSITGAFATAGTLSNNTISPTSALRAS